MDTKNLKGWQYIVYVLIKNNFNHTEFKLKDIYEYEPYFKLVYPDNLNIRPKIRQTLQYLREKGILKFLRRGHYQLIGEVCKEEFVEKQTQEVVYLLSNDAMPEWVKIGRSNSVNRRLRELYNTSVPLPFRLED
jgi:type II restriction enzyme